MTDPTAPPSIATTEPALSARPAAENSDGKTLADLIKDFMTYCVSGLALIVVWLLLIQTYVEHRKNRNMVRELAAYLLIQDVLNANRPDLYIETKGGKTIPVSPEGIGGDRGVPRDSAWKTCTFPPYHEGDGLAPRRKKFYLIDCRPLTDISPERENPLLTLVFKTQAITARDGIAGYYIVSAPGSDIPFEHYGVVLAT